MIAKLKMSLNEYITEKSKFELIIQILFNGVFALIILFGVYISVKMNRGGRSLWYDEMALVESLTNRGLGDLLSRGLDNCQSAPALWLYAVKMVITVLGNNEFNLRLISVLSYMGVMIVASIIGARVFKSTLPLGYGAFVALIGFFVRYSIVCKPYEADALCVLLVILTFYLFTIDKINSIVLSLIWAVLLWFSNPVCFFEGGLLLAYILPELCRKNWKKVIEYIITGITIVISFAVNYLIWLRQSVGYMQDYWEGSQWPLIITSKQDFDDLRKCIDIVFGAFDKAKLIILVLFIAGIVVAGVRKQKLVIGIYLGCVVTLIASYIGFFPVSDRLWCFAYPLIGMLAIYSIEEIIRLYIHNKAVRNVVLAIVMCALICTQTGWRYLYSFNLWWQHEEINAELDYLESIVTLDDNVYVHCNAERGYEYHYRDGNIIEALAHSFIFSNKSNDDVDGIVEDIVSLDNCYIVTTHYTYLDEDDILSDVFLRLCEEGFLQLVYYDHQTALVYYCSDENNRKTEVNPEDYWY